MVIGVGRMGRININRDLAFNRNAAGRNNNLVPSGFNQPSIIPGGTQRQAIPANVQPGTTTPVALRAGGATQESFFTGQQPTEPAVATPVPIRATSVTPQGVTQQQLDLQQAEINAVPSGLIGAEASLIEGATGSEEALLDALGTSRADIETGSAAATGVISGFTDPGREAQQLRADFLGASGVEAQEEAFANFREDPSLKFAIEESERSILRNAAAIGGLGGGNVRKELSRQRIGTALKSFNDRIAQLGETATTGVAAGITEAQIEQMTGQDLATLEATTGLNVAQTIQNLGSSSAELRAQAGRDLAAAIAQSTESQAGFQAREGEGISDIVGTNIANISNLLLQEGLLDSASDEQLAVLLGNLAVGQGTTAANISANIAAIEASGILGTNKIVQNATTGLIELLREKD